MSQPGAAEYRPPAGQRERLRAVRLDPLEDKGLPSKGDDGLLDFQAQEEYYSRIFERYEEFHLRAASACGDALAETMGSLSLHGPILNDLTVTERSGIISRPESRVYPGSSNNPRELSTILMAMRKLREAVVASARKDLFAVRAYIYIIRATILEKHMESYHPALLHVLYRIHPVTALSDCEYSECVGYYILDLACRQDDLSAAYEAIIRFHYMDVKVSAVLRALVHGDWSAFWSIKDLMTTYQKGLLEWAEEGVRKRALDCLGKSYLTVEKEYLERVVRRSWDELVQSNSTQWQLNGNVITIRNMKKR